MCPDGVTTVELSARDVPSPFVAWLNDGAADAAFIDANPVVTTNQRAVRERVPLAVL